MEARKKERNNIGEEDRLSSLSDELLYQIFSFLNIRFAVQTCVLSRRWKDFWKFIPFLDFDYHTGTFPSQVRDEDEEEDKDDDDGDGDGGLHEPMKSFGNLIFNVLSRRHPLKLDKVRFSADASDPPHLCDLFRVISYAVDYNVEELSVSSCCFDQIALPNSFYTCKSLKALELRARDVCRYNRIYLPDYLPLPSLKSLKLVGFIYSSGTEGGSFSPEIFSNCPNLEALVLVDLLLPRLCSLRIQALNLRSLEISFPLNVKKRSFQIVIRVPKLTSFKYIGYCLILRSDENLTCLDNVDLDLCCVPWPFGPVEGDALYLELIKMLREFSRAKTISLSWSTLKLLTAVPAILDEYKLTFPNLEYLKIKVGQWPCEKFAIPGWILTYFLNRFTLLNIF